MEGLAYYAGKRNITITEPQTIKKDEQKVTGVLLPTPRNDRHGFRQVGAHFQVLHDRIVTPGDGLIIFQGMQDSTAESIKSLEGFDIVWVEEAQTLSARSLALLRPTIRKEGSEPPSITSTVFQNRWSRSPASTRTRSPDGFFSTGRS